MSHDHYIPDFGDDRELAELNEQEFNETQNKGLNHEHSDNGVRRVGYRQVNQFAQSKS